MVTIIKYDTEESDAELSVLIKKTKFHCFKCGFVLIKVWSENYKIVSGKCPNSKCHIVSHFLYVGNRFKLVTQNMINKLDSNSIQPYTKQELLCYSISDNL